MFCSATSSLIKNDEFLQQREEKSVIEYRPHSSVTTAFNKAVNYLTPYTYIEHTRNTCTILRSARRKWDPNRLENKHKMLKKIGAEHVQLKTKQGDLIDAMYISIPAFLDQIKSLGGKPMVFRLSAPNGNPYQAEPVKICSKFGTCLGLRVPLSNATQDLWGEMTTDYEANGFIVTQEEEDFLIVKREDRHYLDADQQPRISKSKKFPSEFAIRSEFEGREITGFYFAEDLKEVKEMFDSLKLSSPWRIEKFHRHWFIIKEQDLPVLSIACLSKQMSSLQMIEVKKTNFSTQPTVLLSMNQTASYESYTSEFLTFLFLGIGVCAYNNAMVGLSKGWNTSEAMNETAEAIYCFLTQEKSVLPEEILVKGQCSGFVRTTKLIQDHKKVNVWSDQAPVNFTDVAVSMYKEFVDKSIEGMDGDSSLKKGLSSLSSSRSVLHLVQKTVPSDQAHLSIRNNGGHKLMTVDVPDEFGNGGDKVVPESHVEMLINAFEGNKGKQTKMVFIPGGEHVTDWFLNEDGYEGVVQFLDQTHLRNDLFQKREGSPDQQFAQDLSDAFQRCSAID